MIALQYCIGFKRKETYVDLWLIHADTWQKATHAQLLDQSWEVIHMLFKSLSCGVVCNTAIGNEYHYHHCLKILNILLLFRERWRPKAQLDSQSPAGLPLTAPLGPIFHQQGPHFLHCSLWSCASSHTPGSKELQETPAGHQLLTL